MIVASASDKFTTEAFQRFLEQRKLMGSRCLRCDTLYAPPRPLCTRCHEREMSLQELTGEGRIAGFTSIAIAPTFMIQQGFGRDNPYLTGVIQLAEGPSISGRLVGLDGTRAEEIAIGTPVNAVFLEHEQDGQKRMMLAFQPKGLHEEEDK